MIMEVNLLENLHSFPQFHICMPPIGRVNVGKKGAFVLSIYLNGTGILNEKRINNKKLTALTSFICRGKASSMLREGISSTNSLYLVNGDLNK